MKLEGINVFSAFNGIGCIWIALERCGIKVKNKFSSEIDKYANIVNDANYPGTIQLGDIRNVTVNSFKDEKIDLIVGGSPCQGFSFAGKGLNFEDERSKLFFEFVRLLKEVREINPDVKFLLENVKMKKEHQNVISEYLGCGPVELNSKYWSAQNRKRLYWANFEIGGKYEDKNIFLKDIVEDNVEYEGAAQRGRYNSQKKAIQRIELNGTNKCNAITSVQKDSLIACVNPKESQGNRVYDVYGKCAAIGGNSLRDFKIMVKANTLTPDAYLAYGERNRDENGVAILTSMCDRRIRKLTPIECERLQTVPDNYTNHVSSTQRYKMLGNGWTVDVICHILNGMKQ